MYGLGRLSVGILMVRLALLAFLFLASLLFLSLCLEVVCWCFALDIQQFCFCLSDLASINTVLLPAQ